MGGYDYWLFNRISTQQQQLIWLQQQVQATEKEHSQQRRLLTQKASLTEQINTLRAWLYQRQLPISVLDELAKAMPEHVMLQSLSLDREQVKLSGRCSSTVALTDLVKKLTKQSWLQAPTITTLESAGDNEYKTFSITARLNINNPSAVDTD